MTLHASTTIAMCLLMLAGCRHTSELYCEVAADCTDPSRPYCDVEGATVASDGIGHTCVPDPTLSTDAGSDGDGRVPDAGEPTQLTIDIIGAGTGTVTSSPAGIDCGTMCTASFPRGASITLLAAPDSGSTLEDWSNGCSGTSSSCTFQLTEDTTVAANFRPISVVQVSAGDSHTCALLDTGAIRCWGSGSYGVLGYGNEVPIGDDEVPADAGDVPLGGFAIQVSAGGSHTCALMSTGAVRCWGNNVYGQLGYGHTDSIGDDETPASAGDVPVGGTVAQVAAGAEHTCVRLTTGAVKCWGRGMNGRLGYGNEVTIGDDETPDTVGDVAVGSFVTNVAAGTYHTCVATDSGTVKCWGWGSGGLLGYGNTDSVGDDETPNTVGNVFINGNADQLALGRNHSCARKGTALVCWGSAVDGILGYGNGLTIGDDETPGSAGDVAVGAAVDEVSAGGTHTCARTNTGAVRCWGAAFAGQLGYGNETYIGDNETPASAGDVPVGDTVTDIATGDQHTCVVLSTGRVRCWGWGFRGRLGYGNETTIGDDESPATAGDVPLF